ncbi:MAG: hypothetical protein U9N42_00320 [Campylobacterota bacterium]|nr:hypothetical protein [Campylobacterota bacterium]
MNEMYALGLQIHDVGVWVLVGVVVINVLMLQSADDLRVYAKRMRIFMPISSSLIFLILFTGMVMMAAKHLSFTIENIFMIIFIFAMMYLEAKRYATLKHINLNIVDVLKTYKKKAMTILAVEFSMLVVMSIWMYIL